MNTSGPEMYEQYVVLTWMADWSEDLIEAGQVGRKKQVLDVACGTGIVARKAAGLVRTGGRIAALDLSKGMLWVARECAAREGATTIEWYHGDVSRMPFSSGEFETILCRQGLQFFPDKAGALREMKRVLALKGTRALSVWDRPEESPHVPVIIEVFFRVFRRGFGNHLQDCLFAFQSGGAQKSGGGCRVFPHTNPVRCENCPSPFASRIPSGIFLSTAGCRTGYGNA